MEDEIVAHKPHGCPLLQGPVCVQIAKQLEEARARVEDEVVATVRIATALEARLQSAHKNVAAAEQNAAAAERRAVEVCVSCKCPFLLLLSSNQPGRTSVFLVYKVIAYKVIILTSDFIAKQNAAAGKRHVVYCLPFPEGFCPHLFWHLLTFKERNWLSVFHKKCCCRNEAHSHCLFGSEFISFNARTLSVTQARQQLNIERHGM